MHYICLLNTSDVNYTSIHSDAKVFMYLHNYQSIHHHEEFEIIILL